MIDDDIQLADIIRELSGVDDVSWGLYQFSRDRYRDRLSQEEKADLIASSNKAGRREAMRMKEEMGTTDPYQIAQKLGLRISFSDMKQQRGRIVFATFEHPDKVTLMNEPVELALSADDARALVDPEEARRLMVAHEIYHVLEDRDPSLHTSDRKVVIWKLFGKEHLGTLQAPSEIAAAAFSRELNGASFSPLMLDIMLYWSYDRDSAYGLYQEVVRYYKEKQH